MRRVVLYNLDEAVLRLGTRRHEVVICVDETGSHFGVQVLGTGPDVVDAETIELDDSCFISFWAFANTSTRQSIAAFVGELEMSCPDDDRSPLVVLDRAPWHRDLEGFDDETIAVEEDVTPFQFRFLDAHTSRTEQPLDIGLFPALRRAMSHAGECPNGRQPTLLQFATVLSSAMREVVRPRAASCFDASSFIADLRRA